MSYVTTAIFSAVIGGSGIVGLLFFFIRRYLEKKLIARENEEKIHKEKREAAKKKAVEEKTRRVQLDDELQHCTGRLFFWLHKAVVDGKHNGELDAAWTNYQNAEKEKKDFDRQIIAEHQVNGGTQ